MSLFGSTLFGITSCDVELNSLLFMIIWNHRNRLLPFVHHPFLLETSCSSVFCFRLVGASLFLFLCWFVDAEVVWERLVYNQNEK